MAIHRLEITDFRNIGSCKLEPLSQGFNLIHGSNGSGKTSLLEAIYYLSRGRSFRSAITSRIINNSAEKCSIFAQIYQQNNQITPIGIERHLNGQVKLRLSGKDLATSAELAQITPVQLINTDCFNLLEAPLFRRKYLDWGCFYHSSQFLHHWRSFDRALRQRNAALREYLPRKELDIWTQEIIKHAKILGEIRLTYINHLITHLRHILDQLLPLNSLELTYQPGWDASQPYEKVLAQAIDKDQFLGRTQFGPHRADFKINIGDVPAKDILSRGQQKLFVCGMILAQGKLLFNNTNVRPIYLIDDLPSELDITSRSKLMSLLSKQDAQIFVTAVERETLVSLTSSQIKMFHVEHGCLTEDSIPLIVVPT